ncbi:hypothetical protein G9A89_002743 [Geosiphon pyriformis]|nr:hypothetical protein G9A89_002743 [Geosiphon pyriformis]
MIKKSILELQLQIFNSKLSNKLSNISTKLHIYNAAANLSTTNLSANNTCHLLTAAPTHLSAAASGNLSVSTNSNTAAELISKQNPKAETDTTKLEIINSSLSTNFHFQNYLSLLIAPENTQPNNSETNQQATPTSNILPATIMEDESLDTIFLFELKELLIMPLFSRAAFEEKPITTMYTDAKVDGHLIKLILDSRSAGSIITRQLMDQLGYQVNQAASTKIITADRATKTLISKIDDLPIEVNGIIVLIKVLVMKAIQYQALSFSLVKTDELTTWKWKKDNNKRKEKEEEEGGTCDETCQYTILINDWLKKYPHDEHEIWRMASAKVEGATTSELLEIKNNPLSLFEPEYVLIFDVFVLTKKEQKQHCYHNNKFKIVTTPDTTTLEYYQSIYTHCKQEFNIQDGIEIFKKSLYQYIENRINNYLFGNYNILEVRNNLYNNLVHYSQLGTEDLNSETLATYFQELNFNIIEYCEEKYPVQNRNKQQRQTKIEAILKNHSKHSNTTTAKHLQTPEQRTSVKLPLSITPFPISLAQPQTPSSLLNCFSRPEDFQSPRNPTQQQEPISTSANIIDYLQENESNHSESLKSKETESEQKETTENKEEMATAYIAKIPEFTGENNDTSPQE